MATVGSVSPGCFQCARLYFEPAAGSSLFCRSPEGSQCPLCCSHIFSSDHSFHVLARLSGWASKQQTVLWLSTFPNTAPTVNPTCACGYPRVFPLLPQPLGQLPHLFLCGQRSSGSAGVWTHCQGPCRARGGCLCPWEGLGTRPLPRQLRPGAHKVPSRPGIRMVGVLEEAPILQDLGTSPPDPQQDHHLVGPAWALNQLGCQRAPCTGPPKPIPTTSRHGKV